MLISTSYWAPFNYLSDPKPHRRFGENYLVDVSTFFLKLLASINCLSPTVSNAAVSVDEILKTSGCGLQNPLFHYLLQTEPVL